MSKQKRHKIKNHEGISNEHESIKQRSQRQLFTEADLKSLELSGYTIGRGAPQAKWNNQEHAIPTGVVDIDESVELPIAKPRRRHRHRHSHEHHHDENVHFPQISHQHHRHRLKEIETYDPRWWYMPVNTVHGPRPRKSPEYNYILPKWYHSSRKQPIISLKMPENKSSPRRYVDCRCEVCRPTRTPPRGIKWIVSE